MSYEIPGFKLGTCVAGADLSGKQFYAVKVSSAANDTVALAGAGELAIGILQNKPASGAAAEVMTDGVSKAIVGAAVTRGDKLMVDSAGKLITAAGQTGNVVAVALQSAGGANEIISVVLLKGAGALGALRIVAGQHTTVDADDDVITGLATVVSAVANLEDAPVIGCDRAQAVIGNQAGAPAAGTIQIKTFKPTAAGDATPIAATTFTKKVNWIAIGT